MKIDGLPPLMWLIPDFFGIWIEGGCSSEQFGAICFEIQEKLSDWRNFKKKSPNPPKMVENWNISENRGGAKVFLEIVSIAQFSSDFKTNGTKLFRRVIPFYPDAKKAGIHHIRGRGRARQFSYQQLFRGKLKVLGVCPPLMW